MATIKSYTDLEQSEKLAKILPIESADMMYHSVENEYGSGAFVVTSKVITNGFENDNFYADDIPCWSLAALLNLLPNEIIFKYCYQIHIRKYYEGGKTTLYQIAYGNNKGSSGSWHDMINTGEEESLIDCCVQMIIELHKLKML